MKYVTHRGSSYSLQSVSKFNSNGEMGGVKGKYENGLLRAGVSRLGVRWVVEASISLSLMKKCQQLLMQL